MIVESRGMEDCYFTWIEVGYALPADDDIKIVTVRDITGVYVEMGFYDSTGWHRCCGGKLDEGDRSVIAWACVYPYEKSRHQRCVKEEA